jgi:hypothetical protein
MTYNFDPDKWYEDEVCLLQAKRRDGKLTRKEYDRALTDLDRRLDEMWQRLDGTYQVDQDG